MYRMRVCGHEEGIHQVGIACAGYALSFAISFLQVLVTLYCNGFFFFVLPKISYMCLVEEKAALSLYTLAMLSTFGND